MTGASNVSNAMAYGKQAARAIDKQLMDADRWEELFPPMRVRPDSARRTSARAAGICRDTCLCAKRVNSFDRSGFGLTAEKRMDEACRCLRCDVKVAPSR